MREIIAWKIQYATTRMEVGDGRNTGFFKTLAHHVLGVSNGTGYYMAGCTDSSWKDAACPKQCTSEYGADIIYDSANSHWDCCVSTQDTLNCQQPSNFVVDAPSPDNLVVVKQLNTPIPSMTLTTGIGAISSAGATLSSQSTSSSSSTSTPSTTSATTTASQAGETITSSSTPSASKSNNGLSGGAIAGIVVGCIVGAALIALGALFLLRRRRPPNRRNKAAELGSGEPGELASSTKPLSLYGSSPTEMQRFSAYPQSNSNYAASELAHTPVTPHGGGEGMPKFRENTGPHELGTEWTPQEMPGHPAQK
jgi:hypothetical protein